MSIRIFRVDLRAQFEAHRADILEAVTRVLESGRYTLGEEVAAFEREFAAYLGASDAIGVADGTRAIVMALEVLGAGRGDEVITTPFTAMPTIGAILEVGATPVFADIDPDSYLIDLNQVAAKITPRTKAILPVHMFGNVVDIPKLCSVTGKIPVVEDAAQAHGSSLRGRKVGTMGDFGTYSFYPTKNLGGYGDGGAIVTNRAADAATLRLRRNHGMADKDTCARPGINSRLDELQAAILRVKLRALDAMNAARAARVEQYMRGLPGDRFRHQKVTDGATSNWHIFQTRYLGDRDGLARHLEREGIQSNVYYAFPHHLQPAVSHLGYKRGNLPRAENLCAEVIALPLYPELATDIVDQVIDSIRRFAATDRSHTL
jgi:dTDP-4-amino-4,6-dideoxygalactose transaminase